MFATIDSTVALSFALFVNAAILILAAAAFHASGQTEVAEIQDAYRLLAPTLGVAAPARCSRWRCWPRGRTRPSPPPWPARS